MPGVKLPDVQIATSVLVVRQSCTWRFCPIELRVLTTFQNEQRFLMHEVFKIEHERNKMDFVWTRAWLGISVCSLDFLQQRAAT